MKRGSQWFFGMKAHIGVDADSELVHAVTTTPAIEVDVNEANHLLHGKETVVHADAGYTGGDKDSARNGLDWQIVRRRGVVKALPEGREKQEIQEQERRKASIESAGPSPSYDRPLTSPRPPQPDTLPKPPTAGSATLSAGSLQIRSFLLNRDVRHGR